MSISNDFNYIWYQEDPDTLNCCDCDKPFGSEALIRTFRFNYSPENKRHTRVVDIANGGKLFLYDRHFECLTHGEIEYVAISHVWDPVISRIAEQRKRSLDTSTVRHILISLALKIFDAVQTASDKEYELWYDYISVPQWSESLKTKILLAIPRIFGSAKFTLVHLADLEPRTVQQLYNGTSTPERIEAITTMCNAAWYKRVWTASEFVLSPQVRVLDSEFRMLHDIEDPFFRQKINEIWEEEVRKHGTLKLETMADLGRNFVPWNVDSLFRLQSIPKPDFAHAFATLSPRSCYEEGDFMYALNGIVCPSSDMTVYERPMEACIRIARKCLENGDYSPLIMTPELGFFDPRHYEENRRKYGLNDVFTWGMGTATEQPTHAKDLYFENGDPVLKLAEIGTVTMLLECEYGGGLDWRFIRAATFVVDLTGPDVDDFVASLCTRLYNEHTQAVLEHISKNDRRRWLEEALREQYEQRRGEWWPFGGDRGTVALKQCLGLNEDNGRRTESGLEFLEFHGSTLHVNVMNNLMRVRCGGCGRLSVFRAGLFRRPEYVQGATAYRMPGLEYPFARKDGVGILVNNNGEIVGRMLWAVPTCSCTTLRMVKVKMPKLPPPRPLEKYRKLSAAAGRPET